MRFRDCVRTLTAALALLALAAAPAHGATPEQQCQASKNKAAGAYAACRQSAEAKLATSGDDWDNTYSWSTAFSSKVATLNATSFAGHADWRLPNVNELQSLVDYGTFNPAVTSAFNSGCAPGCIVTSCSCTRSFYYWPSTSSQSSPTLAWTVFFGSGLVGNSSKSTSTYHARAVRGGS